MAQTVDQVAGEAREKLADLKAIADRISLEVPAGSNDARHAMAFRQDQWRLILAALRAQPERGAEEWNYDMSAAPTGQNNPVLVSVPAFAEGHAPFVGEAYYHHASDDTTDHYQGWWWAGTSPSDYWASPIREVNAEPIAWRHLPEPAAIRALPLHPAKDEGEGR